MAMMMGVTMVNMQNDDDNNDDRCHDEYTK